MEIRTAKRDDIDSVARIHKARFSSRLLAQYSTEIVGRFYLEFVDRAIFLVHDGRQGVDGYVVGGHGRDLADCKRTFIKRNLPACLGGLILQPRRIAFAMRQCRALFWPGKVLRRSCAEFRLQAIGVDESVGGQGVADALVDAFEDRVWPLARLYGLSVHSNNARALRFYEKRGFEIEDASTVVVQLIRRLDQSLSRPLPGRGLSNAGEKAA